MGLFSAIGSFFGRILGSSNSSNNPDIKKEESEFEKSQKYIKELEEKMEREKYLKPESKLKDIKLDDVGENLNCQDLRSKQNIKEDLAKERVEEKWEKLDKMLEDI